MYVPQEIGSKVAIQPHWRVLFEALGFWPEEVRSDSITMRRDYPNGALWGCPPGLAVFVASLPE